MKQLDTITKTQKKYKSGSEMKQRLLSTFVLFFVF